jgi:hypothetical protein
VLCDYTLLCIDQSQALHIYVKWCYIPGTVVEDVVVVVGVVVVVVGVVVIEAAGMVVGMSVEYTMILLILIIIIMMIILLLLCNFSKLLYLLQYFGNLTIISVH